MRSLAEVDEVRYIQGVMKNRKKFRRKIKRKIWPRFRRAAIVLLFVIITTVFLYDPEVFRYSTASIQDIPPPTEGVLVSAAGSETNVTKLQELAKTFFPHIRIRLVEYPSDAALAWIARLSLQEVPALAFPKATFEAENRASSLRDLFEFKNGFYVLKTSEVMPSFQLRLSAPPDLNGGILWGKAPLTVFWISDILCQDCRVLEKNTLSRWESLIEKGIARIIFVDVPPDVQTSLFSTALSCLVDAGKPPEDYLALRKRFLETANRSKEFIVQELRQFSVDYERQCAAADPNLFSSRRNSLAQYGVLQIPTLLLGKTNGTEFVRVSGAHDFEDYEKVIENFMMPILP